MGITVEFNPDLCLRAFGTEGRSPEECLPEKMVRGETHSFLKKGHRNYWFGGVCPLRETKGNQSLSKTLAGIRILEVTHFLKEGVVWTRGVFRIEEVYEEGGPVHFDGFEKIR